MTRTPFRAAPTSVTARPRSCSSRAWSIATSWWMVMSVPSRPEPAGVGGSAFARSYAAPATRSSTTRAGPRGGAHRGISGPPWTVGGKVSAPGPSTRPSLSVLDLVPVRSDQTTGDALAATLSLARVADELGYRRYWVAEHHNMPAVAATNPPVLIAHGRRRRRAHPRGLGRGDAAQPRAAGGRRAVRAARGGLPRADRPRDRPGAGQRPGDELRAAARCRRRRATRRSAASRSTSTTWWR